MTSTPTPASPRRVAGLLGTLIALTVVGSSAVAVAIPVVREDLDLTVSDAAWIFAVFQIAFAVSTATFGRLADLQGFRRPLLIGVSLMLAGSVIAGAAPNLGVLLVGRLIQGIGGGAVPVLANGIVGARFTGAGRAAAYGTLTAVVSVVSGSGPIIGGALEALVGWRFVLAVPGLAMLLLPAIVPLAPTDRIAGRFDVRGAVATAAAVSGFLLILQSPAAGWVFGVTGLVLLVGGAAFLRRHIPRHPTGFLPVEVISDPAIIRSAIGGACVLGAYFTMLIAAPLLIADGLGWTPLQIGASLLPAAVVGAVTARILGRRVAVIGHFRAAAVVSGIALACMLLAAAMSTSAPAVVIGMAGAAIGFSGANVALIDRVSMAARIGTTGVALGVLNLAIFAGGAVGTALIGGLSGLMSLPAALAACAVLPLGATLLFLGGARERPVVAVPPTA